jgi:hypothetical protein
MAISVIGAPAGGLNDFSVSVGATGNTTYVLDRAYPAGSYKVSFANAETSYDIYAVARNGTSAGYTRSSILVTTAEFNQMSILGMTVNETVNFEYNGISSSPSSAGDVTVAGAYITSISDSTLVSIDDSTIITGGNFATNVAVTFTGTDAVARNAKSVVRSSSTSLIATRPDVMPVSASPYSVAVSNPGIPVPTGSNLHLLSNSVTVGGTPTWTTTSLPAFRPSTAYTATLVASDVDGSITYSVASGTLPTGLSLAPSTGVISGTTAATSGSTITFRATDSGGNFLDRALDLLPLPTVTGGTLVTTDPTFFYRVFTGNGTLGVANGTLVGAEVLMLAGGGSGGLAGNINSDSGAGGGAGGLLNATSNLTAQNYAVVVGAGAAGPSGNSSSQLIKGNTGGNSTFNSLTAFGGGGGGAGRNGNNTQSAGINGGCGGGAAIGNSSGGTGVAGQGFRGGNTGGNLSSAGGGGTGATGTDTTTDFGGAGGAGTNAYSAWLTAITSAMTGVTNWGTTTSGGRIGGGGGGVGNNGGGAGGAGGGGNSGGSGGSASAGANTGSGTGGASSTGSLSTVGTGGSGLFIVRYLKTAVA